MYRVHKCWVTMGSWGITHTRLIGSTQVSWTTTYNLTQNLKYIGFKGHITYKLFNLLFCKQCAASDSHLLQNNLLLKRESINLSCSSWKRKFFHPCILIFVPSLLLVNGICCLNNFSKRLSTQETAQTLVDPRLWYLCWVTSEARRINHIGLRATTQVCWTPHNLTKTLNKLNL